MGEHVIMREHQLKCANTTMRNQDIYIYIYTQHQLTVVCIVETCFGESVTDNELSLA